MNDWQRLFDDPDQIETCFVTAAEGGSGASLAKLNRLLAMVVPKRFGQWPAAVQSAWQGGMEVWLDAAGERRVDAEGVSCLLGSAAIGYDSAMFRDALAAATRVAFADYLDPAGLIASLGIHDAGIATERIAARWQRFALLAPGRRCAHGVYGVGVVEDIDALTSEVRVRFERLQVLPLELFLDTVQMVRPGSVLEKVLAGTARLDSLAGGEALIGLIGDSLVPSGCDLKALRRYLVPAVIADKELDKRLARGGVAAVVDEVAAVSQRAVVEARSAHELREMLSTLETVQFSAEDVGNIERLLVACAGRSDQSALFRDLLVRLWQVGPEAAWLVQLLRDQLGGAFVWNEPGLFATLTDEAGGRAVQPWLTATGKAVGEKCFAELCCRLPLRLWGAVEQVLAEQGLSRQPLVEATVRALRGGDGTADMALWLWRSKAPEQELLKDITVLMKALGTQVKGAFIRANRELRKLLVRDEEFHAFLLAGRSGENLTSLVRAIEHSGVLDSGEKQSMLVRLVRSFPGLRSVIEKRSGPTAIRKASKITSIRSYAMRRRELEEIIGVRIPANSRAIGVAREHGDLRENAEFKAAKDEQAYLGARRNELERDLDEVRPFDFSQVEMGDQIVPGSAFELEDEQGKRQDYLLLGLWDSVPDRRMLSYDTPLGRAVLSRQVGDLLETPAGSRVKVVAVAALPAAVVDWLNSEDE